MPGMKPGKVVSWKRLLQSEASNLFLWFFGSTLLKHGKHAGQRKRIRQVGFTLQP